MLEKLRFHVATTILVCVLCSMPVFSTNALAEVATPENTGSDKATTEGTDTKEGRTWLQQVGDSFSLAWNEGSPDIFLPLIAWHNDLMYDRTGKFNENPWGFGVGMSAFDDDGDQHGLFALGIMDSQYNFQPIVGYTYIANWELFSDFSLGAGLAAGITARGNNNYIPFPAALPVVSMQYGSIALQATYIPGRYNEGNVLFSWLRWHFD